MRRASSASGRSLRGDLQWITDGAGDLSARADTALRELVRSDPGLAIGAAAGLGFLVGGGIPRGAVTVLLGIGARMGGEWLKELVLESIHDMQDKEQETS